MSQANTGEKGLVGIETRRSVTLMTRVAHVFTHTHTHKCERFKYVRSPLCTTQIKKTTAK